MYETRRMYGTYTVADADKFALVFFFARHNLQGFNVLSVPLLGS